VQKGSREGLELQLGRFRRPPSGTLRAHWEIGREVKNMADEGILSHEEVLELLSERAREGSISAAIALERALRAVPRPGEDWDDELSRIIVED
jgi:hypothetical protein